LVIKKSENVFGSFVHHAASRRQNKTVKKEEELEEFKIKRNDLENELGTDLFNFAYEVIRKFLLKNKIQIDLDNIIKVLNEENNIEKMFGKEQIQLIIENVENIWSMLILDNKKV